MPPRNSTSTSTSCAGYLIPNITLYTYLTTLLGADVFEYSTSDFDFDSDPEEAIDPINRPHSTADAFDIWSEYESWRRRLSSGEEGGKGGKGGEGGEGVPKVFCIVNPEEGEEDRYSLFAPVRLVHSTSHHDFPTTTSNSNSTDASPSTSTNINNSSPPPELETPSDRTHLLTSLQTLNNHLQNPELYTLNEDGIKFTLVPLKQLPPSFFSSFSFSLASNSSSTSISKPHPPHSDPDPESTEYCAGYHLSTIPAFHYVSSLVGPQAFNPNPPDPPSPSSNSNPELDDDSVVDPVGDPHPEDGLEIAAEYHAWRGALGVEERGCEILPFVTEDPEPMISLFIPIRIFYHLSTSSSTSTSTSPTPSHSETQQDRLTLQNILTKLNGHVHEEEHHLDETHVTFLALPVEKFSTRPFTSDKRCTAWDLY